MSTCPWPIITANTTTIRPTVLLLTSVYNDNNYYRAMHFSAKRGIAIACRLSVCLSVCL